FTDINPCVTDTPTPCRSKKYNIATLQLIARDLLTRHVQHLLSRARQTNAGNILIDKTNQATAIKARAWRITTPNIRCTDQTYGAKEHFISGWIKGRAGLLIG